MSRIRRQYVLLSFVAGTCLFSSVVSAASGGYSFKGAPVLTVDAHGGAAVVFRLNRDLPRAPSRRAQGLIRVNGTPSSSILSGGHHWCFAVNLDISGTPRYGQLYDVALEVDDGPTVHRHVRLRHATKGYGATNNTHWQDPKAAQLKCG